MPSKFSIHLSVPSALPLCSLCNPLCSLCNPLCSLCNPLCSLCNPSVFSVQPFVPLCPL